MAIATGSPTVPSCNASIIGGVSILKFGKSLPLIELFETFMIIGLVLAAVTSSTWYTFHTIANIIKAEGGSQNSYNIAHSAAGTQPVWFCAGIIIFGIGIILYYIHRRLLSSPS